MWFAPIIQEAHYCDHGTTWWKEYAVPPLLQTTPWGIRDILLCLYLPSFQHQNLEIDCVCWLLFFVWKTQGVVDSLFISNNETKSVELTYSLSMSANSVSDSIQLAPQCLLTQFDHQCNLSNSWPNSIPLAIHIVQSSQLAKVFFGYQRRVM